MNKLYIFIILILSFLASAFIFNARATKPQDDVIYTLAEFNSRIKNSKKPVLVYFYADWCLICPKLKPIISQIETEYTDKIEVIKVNTDKCKEISRELEIDGLPLIIIYKNGKNTWTYVGLTDKMNIEVHL